MINEHSYCTDMVTWDDHLLLPHLGFANSPLFGPCYQLAKNSGFGHGWTKVPKSHAHLMYLILSEFSDLGY